MSEERQAPFGERLRRLRVAAGLSQEALAERAGLSAQAIGALESGKRRRPYPNTVAALADALGLSERERAELAEARVATAPATLLTLPPLPRRLAPLVGREGDVRAIVARLREGTDRLLTLTGPGGVGKTSLALAVAEAARDLFAGSVAFVSLAAIRDASLVASEVAVALGLHVTGQQTPDQVVRAVLRHRRCLLVLDNLEHLPGAELWISDLLAVCPGVTVLATSRAPLRLHGERELVVTPLALPAADALPTLAEIEDVPAVRLFIERAATPAFALTAANAAAVSAICRRVDGLPLAIELAAARVKVLTPAELLARLDRMLPLLSGGPRDQADRLRSMGAAIAWSYDLLDADERALFRRLAVFAGGFTLDAAEEMVPDSLDLVASLVDKSLLQRLDVDGMAPRFGMLATIQAYGLEQLEAAGEAETARRAHADYFRQLAEQARPAFRQRTGQEVWLTRLETERANLRAALAWLDASGDTESLLLLAEVLTWFWYIRGPLGEGRAWLERALAAATAVPGALRARAMLGAGLLAHFQGDDGPARAWLEASMTQAPPPDDPWLQAFARLLLGMIAEDQADYALAETWFTEALTRFRATDDRSNAALVLTHLGVVAWGQSDIARAAQLCEEALALQRAAEDDWGRSISLGYLGLLAGEQGEYARAAAAHRESLQLRWDAGVWEDIAASLSDLAALAAATGRAEQAARLFGAATALREETGRALVLYYPERAVFERGEAQARATLSPDAYAAAEAAGRALPPERAVAEAMALADELAAIDITH